MYIHMFISHNNSVTSCIYFSPLYFCCFYLFICDKSVACQLLPAACLLPDDDNDAADDR